MHGTFFLAAREVGADDSCVDFPVETLDNTEDTVVVRHSQAAVLIVTFDDTRKITSASKGINHEGEDRRVRRHLLHLHVGVDADHFLNLALASAGNDEMTVQVDGEHEATVTARGRVEQLHSNSKRVILRKYVPLQLARLQHELARLLHTTVPNALLFEHILGLDCVVCLSN